LNSSVICVLPSELTDVIESRPAMVENWFSSGVATAEAIVSGLAPGSAAVTSRVGKSTFGRSLTGSERYATMPNMPIATISRLVAIGRSINVCETFNESIPRSGALRNHLYMSKLSPFLPTVILPQDRRQVSIDHRRQVQRQHLREEQAAHDSQAQRAPRFSTGPPAERHRHGAEQGGGRRHHDRAEPHQAAFIDRLQRRLHVVALGRDREIDLHDSVLLYDADQHHQSDE